MSVLLLLALMSLTFGDTFLHMMSSCTMVIMLKSIIHHEETVKQCHGKAIITGQRKQHLPLGSESNAYWLACESQGSPFVALKKQIHAFKEFNP